MGRTIAIYDRDERYAAKLKERLENEAEYQNYRILTFQKEDQVLDYCRLNKVHLLLVSPELVTEALTGLDISRMAFLSSGKLEGTGETGGNSSSLLSNPARYRSIYKYRSGREMVSAVMECCRTGSDSESLELMPQPEGGNQNEDGQIGRVTGLFSLQRSQLAGQLLPKLIHTPGRNLYLSLEFYADHHPEDNTYEEISDVYYLWKQGQLRLGIQRALIHEDTYDYIPSVRLPSDISGLGREELMTFLKEIMKNAAYPNVWIGLGSYGYEAEFVTGLCDALEVVCMTGNQAGDYPDLAEKKCHDYLEELRFRSAQIDLTITQVTEKTIIRKKVT